jgi:hypothetical protein
MAQKLQNIIKIVDLSESFTGLRFDKRGSLNSAGYLRFIFGLRHQALAFLPAAGNRNNDNGQLNNRGNNGYYWSSTQNSNANNAYNMNLNSSGANTNNNNRTNGFSVRCIAAFNTLFYLISHWIGLWEQERKE